MKTVLVTGAKGTVGNYVVRLAEAAGYRVIASDMESRGIRSPVRGEIRPGDLRDPEVVAQLVRDCDYVIHTAAQLDVAAKPDELAQTNTDAVVRLYEAAAAAGAKRFVHMSTATLYASSDDGPITEDHPLAPRGPYGMSKHGAEVYLMGRKESGGPPWTILRAAPLYGRRGRHFAASLLAIGPLMRMVLPVLPCPKGGPKGTMVHAEDVARALLFVLEKPEAHWEIYNVSDGDVMTLGDRIGLTFSAYGLKSFFVGTPPALLFEAVGRLFSMPGTHHGAEVVALAGWKYVVLRHGLRPALRPRLDREAMTLLYEDLVVDASKLRALGWKPRFASFEEGWKEVLRWYQAEGWVPRF